MDDIQKIIEILGLTPLSQEGGLFRSSYRSPGKVNGRDMGSAIYFMLTGQGYSHLHRLSHHGLCRHKLIKPFKQ